MSGNATVNYHVKSSAPQAFHFDVDGIIGNLISPELVETEVNVNDLRGNLSAVDFDKDGITYKTHQSKIQDFDHSNGWQPAYNDELSSILKGHIAAKDVIIFDHTVRIDDPNAARKPARNVHNDYSKEGAEQRLIDLIGAANAATYKDGHYGFVNVWRPIRHTIKTSPLGFIRPSSMMPNDWMDIDLVYPDRLGRILGVAASEKHDWFYLSDMTPDELAIFNIYDNRNRPHLAHSALDMDNTLKGQTPRMSIESRTLVRYD